MDQPGGGARIEVCQLAAFILDDRIDFVTQSEVDDQSRFDPPVVLKKQGISLAAQIPHGISKKQVRLAQVALKEVHQGRNRAPFRGFELNRPFGIRRLVLGRPVGEDFAAKLKGVLATQIRDVIQDGQNAVGSNDLGPAAPESESAVKALDPHSRKSTIQRVRDTGGDLVRVAVKWVACRT